MNGKDSLTGTTKVHRMLAVLLLVICIGFAYKSTIDNPFVWDDIFLIEQNVFIQSTDNIRNLFTKKYFTQKIELSYRPINTLTYIFDYKLWKDHTAGYHYFNLSIHFFNSLALFLLISALTHSPWLSLGLALLFAVHPINTEALNVVTFREDPLCLLFMLVSVLLYLGSKNVKKGGTAKIFLSLVFLLFALFTKETAVIFPLIIFGYQYFVEENNSLRQSFKWSLIYSIPVAFYLSIRFFVLRGPSESYIYHGNSAWTTFVLMIQAFARYISLSVYPAKQCIDHSFDSNPGLLDPATIAAIFLLVAVAGLMVILIVRNKKSGFGALWFIAALLPVSNIIPIGVVMAERYLYVALPGLLLFTGILLKNVFLSKNNPYPVLSRDFLIFVIILLVVIGGIKTKDRNLIWDSEISFWKATTECSPTSAKSFVNLGISYLETNRTEEAEEALVRAVRLSDESTEDIRYGTLYRSLTNLGIVYAKKNQLDKADNLLKMSAVLNPNSPNSFWNLGIVYLRKGDIIKAEQYFTKGLEIDPNNISPRMYLVSIYHQTGRIQKAIDQCDMILKISPDYERAEILKERFLGELE